MRRIPLLIKAIPELFEWFSSFPNPGQDFPTRQLPSRFRTAKNGSMAAACFLPTLPPFSLSITIFFFASRSFHRDERREREERGGPGKGGKNKGSAQRDTTMGATEANILVSSPDSIARTRALHLEKTMPNFVGCRYAFRKVKVSSTPSTPYLLPTTPFSAAATRGGRPVVHTGSTWNHRGMRSCARVVPSTVGNGGRSEWKRKKGEKKSGITRSHPSIHHEPPPTTTNEDTR